MPTRFGTNRNSFSPRPIRLAALLSAATLCVAPHAQAAYVKSSASATSNPPVCVQGLSCSSSSNDSRTTPYPETLSISSAVADGPDSRQTGFNHASAAAAADLSTGALRARASSTVNAISYDPIKSHYVTTFGSASAAASFEDVLTLHVDAFLPKSASTYQINGVWYKGVTFYLGMNGSIAESDPALNPFNSAVNYGIQSQINYTTSSPLSADTGGYSFFNDSPLYGGHVTYGVSGPRAFSFSYSSGPAPTQSVTVFSLSGDTTITLDASLGVSANGAIVDFSHTALLSLGSTQGVSISSQSGVFLTKTYDPTSPIPEPGTETMLLAGLFVLSLGRRWKEQRQVGCSEA